MENRRYSLEQKIEALEHQMYQCGYCGQDLWRHSLAICEAHHILMHSHGGATTSENLIILCPACHELHDNLALCGVYYGGYEETDIDDTQIRDRQLFDSTRSIRVRNCENEIIMGKIYDFKEEKLKDKLRKHNPQLLSQEFKHGK